MVNNYRYFKGTTILKTSVNLPVDTGYDHRGGVKTIIGNN